MILAQQLRDGGPLRFVDVAAPAITCIDEVGSYAINIVWRDADATPLHSTGIYSFDYLRDLDPTTGRFPREDLEVAAAPV